MQNEELQYSVRAYGNEVGFSISGRSDDGRPREGSLFLHMDNPRCAGIHYSQKGDWKSDQEAHDDLLMHARRIASQHPVL